MSAEEETCPCCLEAIGTTNVMVVPCGHKFHFNCGMKWFTKHSSCPTCRSDTGVQVPTTTTAVPELSVPDLTIQDLTIQNLIPELTVPLFNIEERARQYLEHRRSLTPPNRDVSALAPQNRPPSEMRELNAAIGKTVLDLDFLVQHRDISLHLSGDPFFQEKTVDECEYIWKHILTQKEKKAYYLNAIEHYVNRQCLDAVQKARRGRV